MNHTRFSLLWSVKAMMTTVCYLFISSTGAATADVLDEWYWRNPYPQGNDLFGVAYGAGTFVAVGKLGTVMTSTNGYLWELRDSGTDKRLNQVIYAQDAFVVVGEGGLLLSSTNGVDWNSHPTRTGYNLRGVAFAQGKYVIVGVDISGDPSNPIILNSDHFGQWTIKHLLPRQTVSQVAYGNGAFMAVGGGVPATILVSTNGLDWNDLSRDDIYRLTAVGFGNGVFVTVNDSGNIWTSSDRTNWLNQTIGGFPAMWSVSFVNNQFLVPANGHPAVGDTRLILTSTDGTNWTGFDSAAADPLFAVTGRERGYVAVGQHGQMVNSSDAVVWTNQTAYLFSHVSWFSAVTFGAGRFVAVARDGIATSRDGVNWESANAAVLAFPTDVSFAGGRFLATGLKGNILWSDEGVTWQSVQIAPEIQLTCSAYGSGVYLVAGISAGPALSDVGWLLASTNLTDWETVYQATNKVPRRIVYGNGRFVASAAFQRLVLVSSNGLDWTEVSTGSVGITDMVFANGQFLALEGRSANGVDWTFNSSQTRDFVGSNSLADIAFGDGVFVALDSNGLGEPVGSGFSARQGGGSLWTSTNGVGWTRRLVSPFTIWDVAFGNGTFVAVGEHSMIVQSADLSSLVPIRLSGYMTTNQLFRLTITSAAGLPLTVEISHDLKTWQTLRSLVNQSGHTNLLENILPTSGERFYRARTSN